MSEPQLEPEIMRISWGPQHPMSGQTRILIDVDGEVVHRLIADLGFTHRGIEKILENRTFLQGLVPIERMAMVDTANIGLGYVLAVEEALGIEPPERANWIRSMICEMCRINSHLY
ncbi:MAG: nickel-dependent hydrogenase large subunit, partial [Candidatus Bathyarchaeia archaeon]